MKIKVGRKGQFVMEIFARCDCTHNWTDDMGEYGEMVVVVEDLNLTGQCEECIMWPWIIEGLTLEEQETLDRREGR